MIEHEITSKVINNISISLNEHIVVVVVNLNGKKQREKNDGGRKIFSYHLIQQIMNLLL